mmetsp:Transcript_10642/g.19986  ORF Transcript_10642/g.19986 Transcript_10642/m.19986 type:complete len:183 (+) Transcript_10642:79-627(+)
MRHTLAKYTTHALAAPRKISTVPAINRPNAQRFDTRGFVTGTTGTLETDIREVQPGQFACIEREFSQQDVWNFAELTGDRNPIHFDTKQAEQGMFKKPIVHGLLCASLFPTIFAQRLPTSIYRSQTLEFKQPVFIGERVVGQIKVSRKTRVKSSFYLICETVLMKDDVQVITGTAKVLVPCV